MDALDALDGLEAFGFTEVPDALASPLSSPEYSDDGRRSVGSSGASAAAGGGASAAANEGCSIYVSNLAYAVSRTGK